MKICKLIMWVFCLILILSLFIGCSDSNNNADQVEDSEDISEEVEETGEMILSIIVIGSGSVNPEAGNHAYAPNSNITITATPDTGWVFKEWVGPVNDTTNKETTISMYDNHSVEAVFYSSMAGPEIIVNGYKGAAFACWQQTGNGVDASYFFGTIGGLSGKWSGITSLALAGFGEARGDISFTMPPQPSEGPWLSEPFESTMEGVFVTDLGSVTLVSSSTNVVEILVGDDPLSATMIWHSDTTTTITAEGRSITNTAIDTHETTIYYEEHPDFDSHLDKFDAFDGTD